MKKRYSPLVLGAVLVILFGIGLLFGTGMLKNGKVSTQVGGPPSLDMATESAGPHGSVSEETKLQHQRQPKIKKVQDQPKAGALREEVARPKQWKPVKGSSVGAPTTPLASVFPFSVPQNSFKKGISALLSKSHESPLVLFPRSIVSEAEATHDPKCNPTSCVLANAYDLSQFGSKIETAKSVLSRESCNNCSYNVCQGLSCSGSKYVSVPCTIDPNTTDDALGAAADIILANPGTDYHVGLFQMSIQHCGKFELPTDLRECVKKLLSPQGNITAAAGLRGARDTWNDWVAKTACHITDTGSLDVGPSIVSVRPTATPVVKEFIAPPTPTPGRIQGQKKSSDPSGLTRTIYIDLDVLGGQAPISTSQKFDFGGITPGVHTVTMYVSKSLLAENGGPLSRPYYTACNSTQRSNDGNDGNDCGQPDNVFHNHGLQTPKYTFQPLTGDLQASVSVNVPDDPGVGFAEVYWYFLPPGLPVDSTTLQVPPLADPMASVNNLPFCSVGAYGGTFNNNGNSPNIMMDFTVSNATKAQVQAYEGGLLFFDYTWTNLIPSNTYNLKPYVWNLSPYESYHWLVRSGNGAGWNKWVRGDSWYETSCTVPPVPSSFQAPTSVPVCSDGAYSGVRTNFSISRTTKIEAKLFANGSQIWSNEGSGWDADPAWSNFEIIWSNLSPEVAYNFQVRAANERGWNSWVSGTSWKVSSCPSPPDLSGDVQRVQGSVYNIGVGASLSFDGRVRNSGGATATGFPVQWRINGNPFKTVTHVALPANTSEDFGHDTASYTFTNTGTFTLDLCVDTGNTISESNESNNCLTESITVNVFSGLAELQVGGFLGYKNPVTGAIQNVFAANQVVTALISSFKNTGSIASPGFWVDFFPKDPLAALQDCNGGGINSVSQFYAGPLAVGAEVTNYAIPFTTPSANGTHSGFAYIDSRCGVPESATNDTSNKVAAPYTVVSSSLDSDNDTFPDVAEASLGTDRLKKCPATTVKNDEPTDPWPPDFDDDGGVDILDVLAFKPVMPSKLGDPAYKPRYDLDANGSINIVDILQLKSVFNTRCAP